MLTYMSQQIYFYVSVDDLKESGNSWIMIRHCNHQTTFNNGYQRKNTYQKLHIARTGLRKSFLVKVSVFWNLMTHILLYLYHSFGGVCSRYLQDVQREEEKIELFLNFPEHHSSKFLRNVVTCVTLYKDSYSIGLEWESRFVRNIYGRTDLFCLGSSRTSFKLHTFVKVWDVMIICKNSARSSCYLRRSVSMCLPG